MGKRHDGILSMLKSHTLPKRLLFFDTETGFIEHENGDIDFPFKLGVSIYVELDKHGNVYKRQVTRFETIDDFFQIVESYLIKKQTLYVFAHHITFDLRVLHAFNHYTNSAFESSPPIINNLVFIWSLKRMGYKICFLDTANFGVQSVAQLGEDMGYDKLDVNFDTINFEDLFIYCERDVEILEKFMMSYIQFISQNELGRFSLTIASQAMVAFRTRFLDSEIWLHSHYGATKLERDAYFGGRTEIFYRGYLKESKYYMLDVNSMYPNAMVNYPLPTKLVSYHEDINPEILEHALKSFYVIADVTIQTEVNNFPLRLTAKKDAYNYLHNPHNLEYPENHSNRILFPIGIFRTSLHQTELIELLRKGVILKVHRIAIYTFSNPFNSYIDFFYSRKKQYSIDKNKSWRYITKLFLNALYGKFGQLQPHREEVGISTEHVFYRRPYYNMVTGVYAQELIWNRIIYDEFKHGETAHSNVAIAGAITANARIHLAACFERAGNGNTFYTDTDSLLVNQEGLDNMSDMLDPNEIGYLDIQVETRRAVIRGNKDYMIQGKRVHKGISKTARKVSSNSWKYIQFEGFVTWWIGGAVGGMKGDYRMKSRRGDYKKGIVHNDGKVSPFSLRESS